MAENPVLITNLNDFIFCPVSIYFHNLDYDTDRMSYQSSDQLNGTAAHAKVDEGGYSTAASKLQGISVYSARWNLTGRIDLFDCKTGLLTERKKKIKTIYDGYVFQLYAQYYCLTEMGYAVKKLRLYSMDDNKAYPIVLPDEDTQMKESFFALLRRMQTFTLDDFEKGQAAKCSRCIYEPLCTFSALKEGLC